MAPCPPPRRPRARTLALLALVIAAGVASRRLGTDLPRVISKDAGDVLWPVMFYLLVVVARPGTRPRAAAALAFGVAAASELLKLAHAPPLDALRTCGLGNFLLGRDFQPTNFVAYAGGALVAVGLDVTCLRR
jgi:hypothetical protein